MNLSSESDDEGIQEDPRSSIRVRCVNDYPLQGLLMSDTHQSVNETAEKATRPLATAWGKTLPEVRSVSCLDLCFPPMREKAKLVSSVF